MDVDNRWEAATKDDAGARRERYVVPNCLSSGAINIKAGDSFTQIWLGKVQHADIRGTMALPTETPTYTKWMHSVFYTWYVSPDNATIDDIVKSDQVTGLSSPIDNVLNPKVQSTGNILSGPMRWFLDFVYSLAA